MAKKNDSRFFENKLLDFVAAKDPLLEMLQWVMDKFMEIEVARKISSTNTLERLNREIRRRYSGVGIFPSTDSYIRLITSYLLEYSDDWQTERCYMNAGSIKLQKEILFDTA